MGERERERSAEINFKSDVTKERERERESGCDDSDGIRFEGGERESAKVRVSEEI